MSEFRLDRTAYKMGKMEDMPKDSQFWQTKTAAERLKAAWYLISVAYNFDINNPPRLDRTVFDMGKRN